MKKFFIGATIGVAAISLAACGDSATPTDGTTAKSDLTLEQVFDKAMERQENLQSTKATMTMEQGTTMTIEGEEVHMTSSTNMDMSMTVKPMALIADGTMSMTMADEEETLEMPLKMYLTEEDGFYMNNVMDEGWLKLPNDMYKDMLAQAGANADASEQLKQLEPFINDITFEQTDAAYILTLNAIGEEFHEMVLEQVMGTMEQQLGEEGQSLYEGIQFEDAKYIITIDKETFDITKMDIDFVLTMDVQGVTSKINTASTIIYSDFNEVDTITIPQDVIDTAVESAF
jgi:hypothetical protein